MDKDNKERAHAALSRIKVKASMLENSLVKRIAVCLNALPEEERMKFTSSLTPSMNCTCNDDPSYSSTPRNASTKVRRTGQESNISLNSLCSLNLERQALLLDEVQEELDNSIASVPNR